MDAERIVELAGLSLAAYLDEPPSSTHGWDLVRGRPPSESGFAAIAYKQDDVIAIAFRGTDERDLEREKDWLNGNIALANGASWGQQFTEALEYVRAVRQQYTEETIVLTGHSLGGGLAQVAAAFFGLDGVTFDPGGALNIVEGPDFKALVSIQGSGAANKAPADFTNIVVKGSVVSAGSFRDYGQSIFIDANLREVAEAVVQKIVTSSLPSLFLKTNPYLFAAKIAVAGALAMHDMNGIYDMLVALKEEGRLAPTNGVLSFGTASSAATRWLEEHANPNSQAIESGDLAVASVLDITPLPPLTGGRETDYLAANSGNNELRGGGGDDTLVAYEGADMLSGDDGDDVLVAGPGDDTLHIGQGNDVAFGGSGNDTMLVSSGVYSRLHIDGGAGLDMLSVDFSGLSGEVKFEGITGTGQATGLSRTSTLEAIQNMQSRSASWAMTLDSGASRRIEYFEVERVNLATGRTPSLVIFQGGSSYRGSEHHGDTFYADWSASSIAITWENQPTSRQLINTTAVEGFERMLITTGTGNDRIVNLAELTNDEFRTGAGNDYVDGASGNDIIDTGDGNDTIVASAGADKVHAGDGTDTLEVNYISLNGSLTYETVNASGAHAMLQSDASLDTIRSALAEAVGLTIHSGNPNGHRVEFAGVERVNLATGSTPSLVIFQAGSSYRGSEQHGDTFYADLSTSTAAIVWENRANGRQFIGDVSLQGFERLLVLTGSGADRITNLLSFTNDELIAGAGDDYLASGAGNDVIDAGAGNDTLIGGDGSDSLLGGSGLDIALFAQTRASVLLAQSAQGLTVTQRSGNRHQDTLLDVERLEFNDGSVAFDVDGAAGNAVKLLGVFFGSARASDKALRGTVLLLVDSMGYDGVIALGVHHDVIASLAGSRSNEAFVRLLYRNLFNAEADAATAAYYAGLLDGGSLSREALALLAAETDINKSNVDLMGLASTGIDFLGSVG